MSRSCSVVAWRPTAIPTSPGLSPPAESEAGLIEKLDPAVFERCAHRRKIAGLHARNTVVSFRARNGGLGYAAPLRQLAHGPVEETSCGTDLGTLMSGFAANSRDPLKRPLARANGQV